MGGEFGFVDLARNGGGDDRWGLFVPDVVLYDQNGTDSALFTPHYGG